MCGGAIISDFMLPSRTTRRVNAADLLWDPSAKNDTTRTDNYYSKPLIADLDEDFEADFQGFNDDEILVKPLSFSPKGVENVRNNGMIRDGTGFVTFPVKYQCVVFRPFKGEILEAVVTMVNKMRFFAEAGPVQFFVSNHILLMPSEGNYLDGLGQCHCEGNQQG
ncbi:hypothetical protein POM88_012019 [Heracleum sosnowskyi]|uniref:DNA-directed RNA polymerase subunit n=1 Tax=Heracleum sosnowskyi TaxID=360622 RepID=A0AAD8IX96_9APIA|nr:hypothetical protein POM88_012019 [Heracleum sosnowskyi]